MYRILIIEDDFTMAEAMKKQIESWGNEVRLVSDFQNVIHEFIEYDPHMVLIDIMLPFFNGYHWCSGTDNITVFHQFFCLLTPYHFCIRIINRFLQSCNKICKVSVTVIVNVYGMDISGCACI